MQENQTDFTGQLLAIQPLLHSFVLSALPGYVDQVSDVVQNINLALLRHTADYDASKPFAPWAVAFAKNQIRDFLGRQRKLRIVFNSETLDALADLYAAPGSARSRYSAEDLEHLEICRQRLQERQRALLALRYDRDLSTREIAAKLGNSEPNIRADLSYVRKLLSDCMRRLCKIAAAGVPEVSRKSEDPADSLTEDLIEDGELPPEKAAELNRLLGGEAGRLAVFDALEVHALLKWRAMGAAAGRELPRVSGFARWQRFAVAAVAAGLAVLMGSLWAVRHFEAPAGRGARTVAAVAEPAAVPATGSSLAGGPAQTNAGFRVAVSRAAGKPVSVSEPPATNAAGAVHPLLAVLPVNREAQEGGKTMTMKKTVAAAVASAVMASPLAAPVASGAEMGGLLDLAGTNATLADLSGSLVVTNSSETLSTLTLTTGAGVESAFAGSIVGTNIDVALTGSGTEYFKGTNTYRNLAVTGCTLKFDGAANLCSGTLTLNAGSVFYPTASYTMSHAPYVTVAPGATSVFRTDSGVTVGLCPKTYLTFTNGVIDKVGSGTLNFAESLSSSSNGRVAGGTVMIDEGTLTVNQQDPFGPFNWYSGSGMTIQVNEGGRVVSSTYTALNNVTLVLRGGTYESTASSSISGSDGVFSDLSIASWGCSWFGTAFGQNVIALASSNGAPSVIAAPRLSLADGLYGTTFDVDSGAELRLVGPLFPGYASAGVYKTGEGFTKTGAGMLTLSGCCNADGVLDLEQGTLNLSNGMSYATAMTLHAAAGTQVLLSDRSYLGASIGGGILKEADVWIDPSELACTNGEKVTSVANKGSAGGSFGLFTVGTIPDGALYTTNAINGLGCLEFYGTNGLVLTSFANSRRYLSVFLIVNRKAITRPPYTDTCCWWGGPLSMNLTDTGSKDNEQSGSFHYEYGGNAQGVNVHFGANGSGYLDLGVGLDKFCLAETFADAKLGTADARRYVSDTSAGTTQITFTPGNEKSFRFDRISIGGRLGAHGQASYTGEKGDQMFLGQIGELLVYGRQLSSDERAQVEAYLQRKWFGSTNSVVASTNAVSAVTVNVPAGAEATLEGAFGDGGAAGYGSLVKAGEGTLKFHGSVVTGAVKVAAGRLALGDTNRVSRADIWVDASDTDGYLLESDALHVASITNKGFCGGAFVKNTFNSDTSVSRQPTYVMKGINELPCLTVDGTQGLMFLGYTNKLASLSLNVYCVLRRTGFLTAGWGGPFSLSRVSATANDNKTAGHFHMEQGGGAANNFNFSLEVSHQVGYSQTLDAPSSNSAPFIVAAHANYSAVHNTIITNTSPDSEYSRIARIDCGAAYPLDIDITELGCRLGPGGAPLNGYGFVGEIGEFIVITQPLTVKEDEELVGYLKKKWFGTGSGSSEPPAFLTGAATATTSFGPGTSLSLAAGTELDDSLVTQPLAGLSVGDSVKLVRDGVTAPESFAFFAVTGEISLPAKIALAVQAAPTDSAPILTYGSLAYAYATTWSLSGEKSDTARVYNEPDKRRITFSLENGSRVILR